MAPGRTEIHEFWLWLTPIPCCYQDLMGEYNLVTAPVQIYNSRQQMTTVDGVSWDMLWHTNAVAHKCCLTTQLL